MSIFLKFLLSPAPGNRAVSDRRSFPNRLPAELFLLLALVGAAPAIAQVNVLTAHNDIGRTGQNVKETILKPSVVNPQNFGKLFSFPVKGQLSAQPLYVSQINIPGKGVHNVVYVATSSGGDYVYALDADNNGGLNSTPLWQVSLLTNTAPAGTYQVRYGVLGTPAIDLASKTMYLVSSEIQAGTNVFRLHALDITTGAEKFGGPVLINPSVSGTGSGSTNGKLTFNALYEHQRPGLLFLNGVVYVSFGSVNDNGPWHGWILSYSGTTLKPLDIFCTAPNGSGVGIWMGGAGLAAEVNDPAKPYGRMFVATGNGAYSVNKPYDKTMSYGQSVLNVDLTGGIMTVKDEFTPFDWSIRNKQDGDLGGGGPILLPTETQASGTPLNSLIQIGKPGTIYLLDRNNLGGFNAVSDQIPQRIQTPESTPGGWGAGVFGSPAYWNNHVYFGGTDPGESNSLTSYSFVNGRLSPTPVSQSAEQFSYPGPTPSISSNGINNGITWVLSHGLYNAGTAVLLAYDANNIGNLLYSSNANLARDNPGQSVEYTVPTIANGKVYVDAISQLSVYGILNSTPTVAAPQITPPGSTFTGSQSVSISDATAGAKIYYTTDGSTPTVYSKLYTAPITVTTNTTVSAIASATGYLQGKPVSAFFSSTANAANPVFSLAAGTYTGTQYLTITDTSPGASIYYSVDGLPPTTASKLYTGPVKIPLSETVQAFAKAPGLLASSMVSAAYQINPNYNFDFSGGFANAQALGLVQFNGSTALDDFRLQLTNGGQNQAGSAYYTKKVNVQAFTTDFTFQLSNPAADGITFTIQNSKLGAVGAGAAGLGYQFIPKSVALKFDFFNNFGEGPNSTGLYVNGALPALPATNLEGTGINLRSGDYFTAHVTYDGTYLTLTLTDEVTLATWSHGWPVDIPSIVGDSTAWVGFTGGTGISTASQKVTYWTYLAGLPSVPNFPIGFNAHGFYMNGGAAHKGSVLRLTDGRVNQTTSTFFSTPVSVQAFTADFDFEIKPGSSPILGDGFLFVLQNGDPKAVGGVGGGMGFANLPNSVGIKFDVFDNGGEGNDSTGAYVNGAMPTLPAFDLSANGVKLGSGHVFHAHVAYDGVTLTWNLHDITSILGQMKVSEHVTINIPHTIGSNTAYVGFTASTGNSTAIQNIMNLTFTNP